MQSSLIKRLDEFQASDEQLFFIKEIEGSTFIFLIIRSIKLLVLVIIFYTCEVYLKKITHFFLKSRCVY